MAHNKKLSTLYILFLLFAVGFATVGTVLADQDKEPKANTANVPSKDLKQQILIEETGQGNMALIKGAKVVEITSTGGTTPNLLKVKIFGQDYKIQIVEGTNVVRHYWGKSSADLSEFSVGDIVNAYGQLDATDAFLVKAKTVRNVSIQQKHAVFTGIIANIDPAGAFILQTQRAGSLAVVTSPTTQIYQGKVLKSFSDLQVGMKVLVRGIWNKTLNKIQALLIRINPAEKD